MVGDGEYIHRASSAVDGKHTIIIEETLEVFGFYNILGRETVGNDSASGALLYYFLYDTCIFSKSLVYADKVAQFVIVGTDVGIEHCVGYAHV